ncbi:hypothetical protein L1049_015371 [Liquidambar formosana]|uniref:F-box domain-containing protein n=1 Tax=Liquidambar formosana TaxID=63359 RepID=A0AAP0RZG8_LIQFO
MEEMSYDYPHSDGSVEQKSYNSSEDGSYVSSENERQQRKRRKTKETLKQDQISAMPDSILLHILSFVPTKEAVKTGTLSRRWLNLWTFVPNLHFTCISFHSHDISKFVTVVDQTLTLHKGCGLKKFTVNFEYENSFASHVDSWVRFATRANVEELCLDLYGLRDPSVNEDHYALPQDLYTNSSITKLSVSFCDIVLRGSIGWKSLKSLSIRFTRLSEDVIQKILVGSPVLEFLDLDGFIGFNRLDIGSVSLRKLVVRDYWDLTREGVYSSLEISAPNLQSLSILGRMCRKKFRLMNIQSLVECNLKFGLEVYYEDSDNDFAVHRKSVKRTS